MAFKNHETPQTMKSSFKDGAWTKNSKNSWNENSILGVDTQWSRLGITVNDAENLYVIVEHRKPAAEICWAYAGSVWEGQDTGGQSFSDTYSN